MIDVEQIRIAQEQRLLPVLQAWDDAKQHLEEAIAMATAREQEFHEISEDVRRNIAALDLVRDIASGRESKPAAKSASMDTNRPRLISTEESSREAAVDNEDSDATERAYGGLLRRSSRPLFPNMRKSA